MSKRLSFTCSCYWWQAVRMATLLSQSRQLVNMLSNFRYQNNLRALKVYFFAKTSLYDFLHFCKFLGRLLGVSVCSFVSLLKFSCFFEYVNFMSCDFSSHRSITRFDVNGQLLCYFRLFRKSGRRKRLLLRLNKACESKFTVTKSQNYLLYHIFHIE